MKCLILTCWIWRQQGFFVWFVRTSSSVWRCSWQPLHTTSVSRTSLTSKRQRKAPASTPSWLCGTSLISELTFQSKYEMLVSVPSATHHRLFTFIYNNDGISSSISSVLDVNLLKPLNPLLSQGELLWVGPERHILARCQNRTSTLACFQPAHRTRSPKPPPLPHLQKADTRVWVAPSPPTQCPRLPT